jgi:acetolactate decarboxylase
MKKKHFPGLTLPQTGFSFILILLALSCSQPKEEQTVVQISTFNALLQGNYDGTSTIGEISKFGDFGIGAYHTLDGEMVVLDGVFYQIKSDGKIYKPVDSEKSPFATMTFFSPERVFKFSGESFSTIKSKTDSLMPSPNFFYAIKLRGNFNYIKTRSVPAQKKPYPTLATVTATQPEFEAKSIAGTLVGFYCPPFVTGINVAGYHLHFISDKKDFGGHVLEFDLKDGTLFLDQINNLRLMLPAEGSFLGTKLDKDMSGDMKKVLGQK